MIVALKLVSSVHADRLAAANKGHNIADVLRKASSLRDRVTRAMEGRPAGFAAKVGFKKLTRALIEQSDQAHHALDKATDALISGSVRDTDQIHD